jgi:transcriptional regulator GlxA family with amidase domain
MAQAGYLLERAIASLQTDREAACRCLNDAATLLGVDRAEAPAAAQPADTQPYTFRSGGLARWQARRTLTYIEGNLDAKFGVGQLADLASLSKAHFSRAFRHALGLPPMKYVVKRRVERAKVMMTSTSQPLSDIALACGFSDQAHFSKLFRHCVGIPPGHWRRANTALRP